MIQCLNNLQPSYQIFAHLVNLFLPLFSEDYLALGFMLFPNCKLQLQVMSAGLSRVERLLMQKDALHDEVKNDELSSGSLVLKFKKFIPLITNTGLLFWLHFR